MTTEQLAELRENGLKWLRINAKLNTADAEDVLQDALIELVRIDEAGQVRDLGGMLGYLLDKRVIDKLRSNAARAKRETPVGDTTELADAEELVGVMSNPAYTERPFFAADFDQALRDLPEDQRDAFILYELRGLTEYEAAQILNVPAGTVVSRADLARKALRKEV